MKVMVVAVHPDDETLGAGGTILKHKKNGDSINWLIVTESQDASFKEKRDKEIQKVSSEYGFDEVINLRLPTTTLYDMDFGKLMKSILDEISRVKPEVIYIPFYNDVHTDHQAVSKVLSSTLKSFRYPFIKRVLMMETISETDYALSGANTFVPNYFVDISDFIDKKISILNIFESEVAESPFPRNGETVKALARVRGSSCNKKFAESFMLVKEVIS